MEQGTGGQSQPRFKYYILEFERPQSILGPVLNLKQIKKEHK